MTEKRRIVLVCMTGLLVAVLIVLTGIGVEELWGSIALMSSGIVLGGLALGMLYMTWTTDSE